MTCVARLVNKLAAGLPTFSILVLSVSFFVFSFVNRRFGIHILDYMRCSSRNFLRFLEINITAHFGILGKILHTLIFGDVPTMRV